MKFPISSACSLLCLLGLTFFTESATLSAQTSFYSFQTLAGAPDAGLTELGGLAVDASGNLYVANNNAVIRVSPDGIAIPFAGSIRGTTGWLDGPGNDARFSHPQGLVLDEHGRLYVGDGMIARIRVVATNNTVTTLPMTGDSGAVVLPGPPESMALGKDGSIYLTLQNGTAVYKIDAQGRLTTLAGATQSPGNLDGEGPRARFRLTRGLTLDSQGNVWVADEGTSSIRKITPEGIVTTVIWPNVMTADRTSIQTPGDLLFDQQGNLYVAGRTQPVVFKVDLRGPPVLSIMAGQINATGHQDGPTTAATFSFPARLALAAGGQLYVGDTVDGAVRVISREGMVGTAVGLEANTGSRDGQGSQARFNHPRGVAVDASRTVYVADTLSHTIRKVSPEGTVSTFAGKAGMSGSDDGSGGDARFNGPEGIALDTHGNVYVADKGNYLIRKITPDGAVSTFAGSRGQAGDLDGTPGAFYSPSGLAVGPDDSVYVADLGAHKVRKVSPEGVVSTVESSFWFNGLRGVALGPDGSLSVLEGSGGLIGDLLPTVVVQDPDGIDLGNISFSGLAIDNAGTIFMSDVNLHSIARFRPTGVTSVLTVVASRIAGGYAGLADGPGLKALFRRPAGIAVDKEGSLYVADEGNSTIRKGIPYRGASVLTGPQGGALYSGYSFLFSATAAGDPPIAFQWLFNGTNLPGATNATLSLNAVTTNQAGVYRVIVSNAFGTDSSAEAALLEVTAQPPLVSPGNSQSVFVGANVTIRGNVNGSIPLAYQWLFNGSPLDGETNIVLRLTNLVPAQSGTYTLKAMNPHGTGSTDYPLTVMPVALGVGNLRNQTVYAGDDALFSARTFGSGPISCQWLHNGVPVPGATNANLGLIRVRAEDAGGYRLVLTGPYQTFTNSVPAVLTVLDGAPVITRQPVGQNVRSGGSVSFSVAAQGTATLRYQWWRDAQELEGATNSALVLSGVTVADAGKYWVSVFNALGMKGSAEASLTVPPLAESAPPEDVAVVLGGATTLSAPDGPPGGFQWLQTGVGGMRNPVPGATQSSLVIGNVSTLDAGLFPLRTWMDYSVQIAAQSSASVTSRVAIVSAFPAAPALLPVRLAGWSHDVVVENGPVARVDVSFDDAIGSTHDWIEAGLLSHGDGLPPSRRFASVKDTNIIFELQPYAGPNVMWIRASSSSNLVSTLRLARPAPYSQLAILAATTFGSGENSPGAMVLQFTDGSCSDPLRFNCPDWWVNGSTNYLAFGGLTEAYPDRLAITNGKVKVNYPVTTPAYGMGLYQTEVDLAALGLANKDLASITFQAPKMGQPTGVFAVSGREIDNPGRPYFVADPAAQLVQSGGRLRLSCLAVGEQPIEYQWFKDGVAIPDVSGPVFTVDPVYARDAARYTVVAKNAAGTALSAPALVEVHGPPTLAIASQNGQPVLSWPEGDFVLERRSTLGPDTGWEAVTTGIVTAVGQSTYAIDVSDGTHFFRLRQR